MFKILYSNQACNFLKKSDKVLAKRIIRKIEELGTEPVIHDTKMLEGYKEKLFRVRIGDYRILYEVDYKLNIIGIVKIDKRSKVYD
ncbi:MAG: type II toxin-antitoxin system RelE/ParE family toxin [Nanoarchaeota archaeon]|nr:type II toxin-antitoxin system RelE/ParE family toxin [Nanoarchaeota archaeon]MBU4300751.1 type II toxin-antitoxin system RelE/ParE family toxin [Nanoarchaeota archaeon]MBU4452381.1 type II toxin-antitoxin system RelE/ParE family toxin [Nanoarchaeota archaeon]MCG2723345.1 type II toxin-antitoxin system RelE/ParE family toxin [archaeon]